MNTAPLDRRVAVQSSAGSTMLPLSRLRDRPYVVLLGEPGLGKTTSLEHEAKAEGCQLATCREVMNGAPLASSSTAYLDALDEYRSGDSGKDKLLQLANAISASGVQRWRLTCRAEDWRDAADMNAMRRAANNEPIVVARLLPLDDDEARTVLNALGATNPQNFLDEAHRRGAGAFLESPLSLRLLHFVILSNGVWPTSRFELFDKAIWALAHEHNPDRATDPRARPETIIEAASNMCFYALASGTNALWRSNALAPNAVGKDYLSIHSLDLDPSIAASALDTAIFRGEGHVFEPIHKTVSEFLAARNLAKKVVGNSNSPAFPLRRAIALITGNDHRAPSELRGLYAWFAAHLHKLGDSTGALQMIEHDAATVLAYGDAAAFDTAGRKAILFNLDREDPYFLASQDETTVLGGLAGEDLASDFLDILDMEVRSQLQVSVLQALANGPPVAAVQTKLHEIALGSDRPLWMRQRATEVLIKSSTDEMATRHKLLKEFKVKRFDTGLVILRAQVLSKMAVDTMSADEIRQILTDFNALPTQADDDEIEYNGALISLEIALCRLPRGDIFDSPIIKLSGKKNRQRSEVRSFLGHTLAAAIIANPEVKAQKLWEWISNAREDAWDMLDSEVVDAIQKWIDCDTGRRELELFVTLLNDSLPDEGPWMASHHYTSVVRRPPSKSVVKGLIELAKAQSSSRKRKRMLQVAAYAARNGLHWPAWRDEIVAILGREGGLKGFISSLLLDPSERWNRREAERRAKEEAETEANRRANISELTPRLATIASGNAGQFGVLKWASEHYRNAAISKKTSPMAGVIKYTNEEIAAAIAEGFVQFAIHTDIKIDATKLGEAEARNAAYHQEYVVGAGLHQALLHRRDGELDACPLVVALVGLRQSYFSGDDNPSIALWAVDHLARDPDQGTAEVLKYWNAALDAGDDDLDSIHHLSSANEPAFLSKCLQELLSGRPNLPERALRQALDVCSSVLTSGEIADLVARAVRQDDLVKGQKDIWNFVALALMPKDFASSLSEEDCQAAILAPNGKLAKSFDKLCPQPDLLDRIRVAVLGRTHAADEDDWRHSGGVSGIVRGAIRRLSASKNLDAGDILKTLAPKIHASWQPQLAHSAAEHARKLRDELYIAPSVGQLIQAVAGGPPASPADLVAIVLEEIARYKRTLRSGSEMPWKRFWNTDKNGAATTPQIENEDRDRLLELFRTRFEKYGVAASMPEARRAENTRADVLLLSHAGKNLPIEAKRHYNRELWTAPVDQLKGYASDEDARGFGIYVVFWFGVEFKVPAREDDGALPATAQELENLLVRDLPPAEKDKLTIVVLDVSRPKVMSTETNERKKKVQKSKKA